MKYNKTLKSTKKTIPAIITALLIIGLLQVSFVKIANAATDTITADSDDGYIYASAPTYLEAHDASSGTINNNMYQLSIGQQYFDNIVFDRPRPILDSYSIYRGFIYFDTSSIPAEATITSVSLKLITFRDYSNTDFDIIVINGQPTYPHKPLQSNDYAISHYSGNGGSWNTANYPGTGQEITIALNSNGKSWIQKGAGAETKFALLSSRDINGNIPIPQETRTYALEYVTFYSANSAGNEPKLEVTYTTNSPPNTPSQPSGPNSRNTGQSGTYTTTATDPDGNQVQYRFDWDANGAHDYSSWTSLVNSGTSSSLSHTWTNPGTYTVKAQARDSNRATSSWSNGRTVTVTSPNNPPTASYTANPNPATTGQNINFDASTSSDTDGFITTYEWDWDNNGIYDDTGLRQIHSWPTHGNYPVTLRVTDDDGVTDTDTQTITINPLGNVPPNKPILVSPGNGNTLGSENTATLSVTATDLNGGQINVSFYGNGNFLYNETKASGSTFSFTWNSLNAGTRYNWYAVANDSVFKNTSDTWSFTTYSNGGGGGDDDDDDNGGGTITNTPPTAKAGGPYTGTINAQVTFDGSESTDAEGPITGYKWDFENDGEYDTDWLTTATTTHTYSSTGIFTVKLRVKDNLGTSSTDTATVDISEVSGIPPTADAGGPYAGLTYQIITFDGSDSYDSDGSIVNYTWNFDDGTVAYGKKIVQSFNTSGSCNVTLTVTDNSSLTDSNTTTITIKRDTDGDGWSDEIEESYETNTTDSNDYPEDTDNDGIPDEDSSDDKYVGDFDDDNDGLGDIIEEMIIGSDSKNNKDVILREDGNYDIDFNGDAIIDGVYNPISQKFMKSEKTEAKAKKAILPSTLMMIIAAIISTIIVIAVALLYNKHPQPIANNIVKTVNPLIPETSRDAVLFEQQIDQIIQEAKQADSKLQNAMTRNKNGLLIEKEATNKTSLIVDKKDETTPSVKDALYDHEPVNNRSIIPDGRYGNGLSLEHKSVVNTQSGASRKDNSSSSANNGLIHGHPTSDDKQKTVQSKSKTSSSRKHDNLIYEHGPVNNKYKSRAVNNKNRNEFSIYHKTFR